MEESTAENEIVKSYIEKNPEDIKNDHMKVLISDRSVYKNKMKSHAKEMKKIIDELQTKAAQLQIDISSCAGSIKYIDDKIVQCHIEMNK